MPVLEYGVVFDMDGVIFDSEKCVMSCWDEVAQRHDLGDFHPVLRACLGVTREETKQIMRRMRGPDFPAEAFMAEASEIYHARYDKGNLPIKPGVVELLSYLHDSGTPVALASSTREATVRLELKAADLLRYFDTLVCGDMVTRSKPDPEIYTTACVRLGVPPENCFGIEDSFNGIRSAHAAGLRAIMVPDLVQPDDTIRALCEHVFPSLHEVLTYLKEL